MDEELTQEEAEWIVANRQRIRESAPPTGMVIGPLSVDEMERFLRELFSRNLDSETGSE